MIAFWAAALALTLLLYVLLDGFDLGVGMLFGIAPSETARRHMMQAIAPSGTATRRGWCSPPRSCSSLPPRLRAAALGLLPAAAADARRADPAGVAFEFRAKSRRLRGVWDAGFVGGSACAAFVQGTTVGALVQELPIRDGLYVGGAFAWLSPFSLLCGLGLCLGYALLGAAWLCGKTEDDVRDLGFRMMPRLLVGVLVFLAAAFLYALAMNLRVLHRGPSGRNCSSCRWWGRLRPPGSSTPDAAASTRCPSRWRP